MSVADRITSRRCSALERGLGQSTSLTDPLERRRRQAQYGSCPRSASASPLARTTTSSSATTSCRRAGTAAGGHSELTSLRWKASIVHHARQRRRTPRLGPRPAPPRGSGTRQARHLSRHRNPRSPRSTPSPTRREASAFWPQPPEPGTARRGPVVPARLRRRSRAVSGWPAGRDARLVRRTCSFRSGLRATVRRSRALVTADGAQGRMLARRRREAREHRCRCGRALFAHCDRLQAAGAPPSAPMQLATRTTPPTVPDRRRCSTVLTPSGVVRPRCVPGQPRGRRSPCRWPTVAHSVCTFELHRLRHHVRPERPAER